MPRKLKVLNVDANSWAFVSVRLVMEEALRLSKSKRALLNLSYNGKVIKVSKDSVLSQLIEEYFEVG